MKIFSVDAEVNGLYGPTFAIGATVRVDGKEVAKFQGRLPDSAVTHEWGLARALPAIKDMKVTHATTTELEEAFWQFWIAHRIGSKVVAHCGAPVESGLFRRCIKRDLPAREWFGPFPAINDVATLLLVLGEPPDSVDNYVAKHALHIPVIGEPHNPYYDSVIATIAWEHAFDRLQRK